MRKKRFQITYIIKKFVFKCFVPTTTQTKTTSIPITTSYPTSTYASTHGQTTVTTTGKTSILITTETSTLTSTTTISYEDTTESTPCVTQEGQGSDFFGLFSG